MTCITNTEHYFLPILCVDFSSILIDYNLYRKFWSLQDYFRKPVQCFDKAAWRAFAMVYFFTTSYQPWPDGSCFPTMTMEEQKRQKYETFKCKVHSWYECSGFVKLFSLEVGTAKHLFINYGGSFKACVPCLGGG